MNSFKSERDGREVQALVRSAFGKLTHCRYFLLRISDARAAVTWIKGLLEQGLVKSAADVEKNSDGSPALLAEVVQLAFSYRALKSALRLPIADDFPFPTIFAQGMAAPERAPLLGDDANERAAWRWSDAEQSCKGADLLVVHYRQEPFDDAGLLAPRSLGGCGVELVQMVETCPFYVTDRSEPFGFKDGISQPRITGMHFDPEESEGKDSNGARRNRKRKPEEDPDAVPPGELLLGQINAYGERAYCPDVDGFAAFAEGRRFAANGSYVAVRQIWQDTDKAEEFERAHAAADGSPTPFERMIGRRKDGAPLRACPVADPANEEARNDFLFRVDDYEGFHCPRGAHIRRGNPRDALGWDSASGVFASRLHRILRRGRVYRHPGVCAENGACDSAPTRKCGRGLFFIALNADLERQFEFVQRQWLNNAKFGNLWQETDALGGGDFSMPGYMPVGTRLTGLPQFTRVIGGGYFFLPSLSALRFIARLGD
jgi:putative iron-dependent peroxidase